MLVTKDVLKKEKTVLQKERIEREPFERFRKALKLSARYFSALISLFLCLVAPVLKFFPGSAS